MNKNLRMKTTVLSCIWLGKDLSFLRAYLADSYLVWLKKKKSDCCYNSPKLFALRRLNINSLPLPRRLCDRKDLCLMGQDQTPKRALIIKQPTILYNLVLLLTIYTILQV